MNNFNNSNYYNGGYNTPAQTPPPMHGQQPYAPAAQFEREMSLSGYISKVMSRVYLKMFGALTVTALVAFFVSHSPALLSMFFGNQIVFWGLIIAELGIVIALSAAINKLSSPVATALFYLYSVVNGITMAVIFLAYTGSSIALTFAVTGGVFLAMSIYGYTTKQDLTKFGTFMVMLLIGLIIASIVNIFVSSSTLEWIISFAGVAVFVGLTAWDTQKIKNMAMMTDDRNVGKLATMGALSLYLDFVNLFLYLLRFFGSSRD